MADIVLVLDESGSMGSQRQGMIGSVNELIQSQRREAMEAAKTDPSAMDTVLHIYRFSDKVKTPITGNIGSFPKFTKEHYNPDGMTALFDAIGTVTSDFERRSEQQGATARRVVLVIATDGVENASKEYTRDVIKAKLKDLQERKPVSWTVMYLSEDKESQGCSLGIGGKSNKSNAKQGELHSAFTSVRCQSALAAACRGNKEEYDCAMDGSFFS